jgi:hypothetical protein
MRLERKSLILPELIPMPFGKIFHFKDLKFYSTDSGELETLGLTAQLSIH